jgi:hypothetical protein
MFNKLGLLLTIWVKYKSGIANGYYLAMILEANQNFTFRCKGTYRDSRYYNVRVSCKQH